MSAHRECALGDLAWRSFAALAITFLIAACSDRQSLKWKEDVLLPDGRTVTLTRYQEFKGPYEIGDTPTESYYWFEFVNPDTGEKVRWETKREPGTVALLIHDKVPLLLTRPAFGSGLRDLGCPDPPYLLYRYAAGKWEHIDLKAMPLPRLRSNMTYAVKERRKEIEASNHHLSADRTALSIYQYRPWILDFTKFEKQTFDPYNCNKRLNQLLADDAK